MVDEQLGVRGEANAPAHRCEGRHADLAFELGELSGTLALFVA
jgi:hypothetical protein